MSREHFTTETRKAEFLFTTENTGTTEEALENSLVEGVGVRDYVSSLSGTGSHHRDTKATEKAIESFFFHHRGPETTEEIVEDSVRSVSSVVRSNLFSVPLW